MSLLAAAATTTPADPGGGGDDPFAGPTRTTIVTSDAGLASLGSSPWGYGTWYDFQFRTRLTITKLCRDVRVTRHNWNLEGGAWNPFEFGCDIEKLDGTIRQFTFDGNLTGTVPECGYVLSDADPNTYAPGELFMRPYIALPSFNSSFQGNSGESLTPTTGNDATYFRTGGGRVTGPWPWTTPAQGGGHGQRPQLVIGETPDLSTTWAIAGDSITTLDGWAARTLAKAGVSCLIRGIGARTMGHLGGPMFDLWFQDDALTYVDHFILAMGRNDGGDPRGSIGGVLTKLRATGFLGQIVPTTITPYTSSTDGWASTAGQTHYYSDANRIAYNTWLRDGGPWNTTTGTHAATGSNGAAIVRFGDEGHPCTGIQGNPHIAGSPANPVEVGYLDVTDTCETARNSGIWRVDGGIWCDGLHPTAHGAQQMADQLTFPTA